MAKSASKLSKANKTGGKLTGPFVDAYVKQYGKFNNKKFQSWISNKAREYETTVNPWGKLTEMSFLEYVNSPKSFDKYRPVNMSLKEKETAGELKLPKEGGYGKSLGVDWHVPNRKRPIYRSTTATSNEIALMAKSNPKATIKQLYESTQSYNTESWKVLKAYINKGHGDVVASKWFKY